MNLGNVFASSLVALVFASIAAPFVFRLLLAMKSRQTISQHIQEHAHKQGTPTMGGIIVLCGLIAGMVFGWRSELLAPLVLVVGFGAVGFLDDYLMPRWKPGSRGLGWMPKLGLEIGAAVLAAFFMGWQDPFMMGFFVFMVLFLSNAYNFADGLDGLAGGLGMILCFGLALHGFIALGLGIGAPQNLLPAVVLTMSILAVSFIPFLMLNAPPAKVFMGDVGALPIGAVLGWACAVGSAVQPLKGDLALSPLMLGTILIFLGVMFIEIVPVPLQIASVKLRKKRLFNFKTPVHHAFQDRGWPETRIVWTFHLVQIGLLILGFVFLFQVGSSLYPENFNSGIFAEADQWSSHR